MIRNTLLFPTLGLAAAVSLHAQGGYVFSGVSDVQMTKEQRFVRPVTAPYFHEDSFITSDVRAWYLNHQLDTIDGHAQVYALQLRLALTQALQFVAYKDGYANIGSNALGDPDGMNDIGAGLKWAFLRDWENQFHAAVGVGYEIGLGDSQVLQQTNDLRFWASVNKGYGKLHLGATANLQFGGSSAQVPLGNADLFMAHLHADYYSCHWFSPVVEMNGYFVTNDDGGLAPASGVDAVSLGGGEGEPAITLGIGGEFRPLQETPLGLRIAYETEVTGNTTIFEDRWTLSAVYEF